MMILITGARGFVGQNLVVALEAIKNGYDKRADHIFCNDPQNLQVVFFNRGDTLEQLDAYSADCDIVFHLAGANRPEGAAGFMEGNRDLTAMLLDRLRRNGNPCPVVMASSVQAALVGRYADSEYGKSKQAGEELVFQYGKEMGAEVFVYRFPNIFGKWCRPNYNSAIATFCYNVANNLPIHVNDPSVHMELVYIDDVVEEMIQVLRGKANKREDGFFAVPVQYEATLGSIADTILSFPPMQEALSVPRLDDPLTKKLYSTYLSYLPPERIVYDLQMNCDARGSFTEIIHTIGQGQFSVNISKPGATKGNHWHNTKNEKFVVVKGQALIRLRRVGLQPNGERWPVEKIRVSDKHIQVVEMIPGYVHSIINLSDTDELVMFIWTNEVFDKDKPDTFFEQI